LLGVESSRDVVGCTESGSGDRLDRKTAAPQRGNTVYVHGHGVSEETLRRAFTKIGGILNISMDRKCVFSQRPLKSWQMTVKLDCIS